MEIAFAEPGKAYPIQRVSEQIIVAVWPFAGSELTQRDYGGTHPLHMVCE
jgi:hypothetical protein